MKRDLIEIAKRRVKTALKDAYYLPVDAVDRLLGRRDSLTPPVGSFLSAMETSGKLAMSSSGISWNWVGSNQSTPSSMWAVE